MLILCLCAQNFQRRTWTCLPCIRDWEMESLCAKGILQSLSCLLSLLRISVFLPPDRVFCLLEKIWPIIYLCCHIPILNVYYICSKNSWCLEYCLICLLPFDSKLITSAFFIWKSFQMMTSQMFFAVTSVLPVPLKSSVLVFLLSLCFFGLFPQGPVTFPCWNIIGNYRGLSHFLHSVSSGKLDCYLYDPQLPLVTNSSVTFCPKTNCKLSVVTP